MSQTVKTIANHVFEVVSDTEVKITYPDGKVQAKHYLAAEQLWKKLKRQEDEKKGIKSLSDNIFTVKAPYSAECHKLRAFASALNGFVGNYNFVVKNIYYDYDAGLQWTTVVAEPREPGQISHQILEPKDMKVILGTSYTEYSKLLSSFITKYKSKKK